MIIFFNQWLYVYSNQFRRCNWYKLLAVTIARMIA